MFVWCGAMSVIVVTILWRVLQLRSEVDDLKRYTMHVQQERVFLSECVRDLLLDVAKLQKESGSGPR